ncbi:MAG: hypothetical protein PHX21_14070 [bacterium]|nr:hypothetical protein [bacterium]
MIQAIDKQHPIENYLDEKFYKVTETFHGKILNICINDTLIENPGIGNCFSTDISKILYIGDNLTDLLLFIKNKKVLKSINADYPEYVIFNKNYCCYI